MTNIVATRGWVKLSACSDPAVAGHTHETSTAAFESLDPELKARREQQILKYIGARGGATCWEIENALGLLHQSASSTITRLRKTGHLVDTGERRPTNTHGDRLGPLMESVLLEQPVGAESSLPNDIARVFTKPPPQSDDAKPRKKLRNRFGGLSPSEGATLPPLTYWNADETLPRRNMGGCVGFLVGQYGSHKTGTAIMLAL